MHQFFIDKMPKLSDWNIDLQTPRRVLCLPLKPMILFNLSLQYIWKSFNQHYENERWHIHCFVFVYVYIIIFILFYFIFLWKREDIETHGLRFEKLSSWLPVTKKMINVMDTPLIATWQWLFSLRIQIKWINIH